MRWRWWCSALFTWSFVHLIEQVLAEGQRGAAKHAVGPALADCLQQKCLGPRGLDSEVGELENALCGGDWRSLAPETKGDVVSGVVRKKGWQ